MQSNRREFIQSMGFACVAGAGTAAAVQKVVAEDKPRVIAVVDEKAAEMWQPVINHILKHFTYMIPQFNYSVQGSWAGCPDFDVLHVSVYGGAESVNFVDRYVLRDGAISERQVQVIDDCMRAMNELVITKMERHHGRPGQQPIIINIENE